MVPLVRYSAVAGIPVPDLVEMGWSTAEKIDQIVQRTRDGGAEIVSLLKLGLRSMRPPRRRLKWLMPFSRTRSVCFPARPHVDCAYGLNGLYVVVPVIIGAGGVERVVEIALNEEEQAMFENSVSAVKALNEVVAGLE